MLSFESCFSKSLAMKVLHIFWFNSTHISWYINKNVLDSYRTGLLLLVHTFGAPVYVYMEDTYKRLGTVPMYLCTVPTVTGLVKPQVSSAPNAKQLWYHLPLSHLSYPNIMSSAKDTECRWLFLVKSVRIFLLNLANILANSQLNWQLDYQGPLGLSI